MYMYMYVYICTYSTCVSGIVADHSVSGKVHGAQLVGATLKGELGVLDVEEGEREVQGARYGRLSLLQELQLYPHKLHPEQEPRPYFRHHWLDRG